MCVMAKPKQSLNELRIAFLDAIRPIIGTIDHPGATAAVRAIDAYAEYPTTQEADSKHRWVPANHPGLEDAPPRALTTLSKPECVFRGCSRCATVSNSAYPYWFKVPGGPWSMKRPPCIHSTSTEEV